MASVVIPPFSDFEEEVMSESDVDVIALSCAASDKVENSKTVMVARL